MCVECHKRYEKVTRQYRTGYPENPAPLFLSYVQPHKPDTTQRMVHWIKDLLLKEARVDTEVFKAHSVRGASTLAALKKGVHLSVPLGL